MRTTLFMHAHSDQLEAARHFAEVALQLGHAVVIAGDSLEVPGATMVRANGSFGDALKAALPSISTESVVIQSPDRAYSVDAWERLLGPVARDEADVVVGHRSARHVADALLEKLGQFVLDGLSVDVGSGQKAARTQALVDTSLSTGADEAELLVKLSSQLYRFVEVRVEVEKTQVGPMLRAAMNHARTFARYASTSDDADNLHEGYSTLANLEASAPNYNAWLGEKFRSYAGQRILEIGAGIGTITSHLAPGKEKVIALEVDPFYVRRLQNRFRGQANVAPQLSDLAMADWERLRDEKLDAKFLEEAEARGLSQLKGHRSVGGMRASIYNAMPAEGVDALVAFMKDFARRNG